MASILEGLLHYRVGSPNGGPWSTSGTKWDLLWAQISVEFNYFCIFVLAHIFLSLPFTKYCLLYLHFLALKVIHFSLHRFSSTYCNCCQPSERCRPGNTTWCVETTCLAATKNYLNIFSLNLGKKKLMYFKRTLLNLA